MFRTSVSLRSLASVARASAAQVSQMPVAFTRPHQLSSVGRTHFVGFNTACRAFSSKGVAPSGKNGNGSSAPSKGGAPAKKPAAAVEPESESDGEWEGDSEGEVMELTDALAAEITVEASEEAIDPEFEDIKAQMQEFFTVHDEVGKGMVTLRSIPGKNSVLKGESLEIQFDCQDEAEQGMDDVSQLEQLQVCDV